MVGMSTKTYRIKNIVRKEWHVLNDDDSITQDNLESCRTEAEVYLILGQHPLIAKCLFISPEREYIELEYYANGNIRDYLQVNRHRVTEQDLKKWARQMVESVAYSHSKGVRHSDVRLDQWLVDSMLNARLCDFNTSGFDDQPDLGLKGWQASGLESGSHYLPRNPLDDNTIESDLFCAGLCTL